MKSKPARPQKAAPLPLPSISDAEWVVMRVVCREGAATANQVVAALEATTSWKPKTIHTLLRRLVQKGALAYDKLGREFQFRPLVDAEQYTHVASRSFLDRFFGGHLAPFLACFLEREKLTAEEARELRRILEEKLP
jgi:BlaI family transcriptional regulator, penicillinase repressor